MSRFAVISDIHGNLHALHAVLSRIDRLGVDDIICLGDIVGYGPHPAACLDLVLSRCGAIVRGNHDDAVMEHANLWGFNGAARAAIIWTKRVLEAGHLHEIGNLPQITHVSGIAMCVHDTPIPASGGYLHDARAAAPAFRGVDTAICLVGHTHVPMAFGTDALLPEERVLPSQVAVQRLSDGSVVELDPGCRYILNPGAVGQPRDSDPRASFAVLDLGAGTFSLYREEYDIASAQEATRSAGLPTVLAERLTIGA